MRKLALVAAFTIALAARSKPAEAGCGGDCPPWVDALAIAFGAALAGGYAYGTGYFIYHDVNDEQQSLKYAAGEVAYNALFGTIATAVSVSQAQRGKPGQAVLWGSLGITHALLASHGVWRAVQQRGELQAPRAPDDRTLAAFAGLGYATNTLIWALAASGDRGRAYGIAEAAVNAPIAAGLGYLAAERARDGETGKALLFGGMAAISGALAVHGVYTAIRPHRKRDTGEPIDFGIELEKKAGLRVSPTIVSDGKETAPGVGLGGSW